MSGLDYKPLSFALTLFRTLSAIISQVYIRLYLNNNEAIFSLFYNKSPFLSLLLGLKFKLNYSVLNKFI